MLGVTTSEAQALLTRVREVMRDAEPGRLPDQIRRCCAKVCS
jgi:hypothetical protein